MRAPRWLRRRRPTTGTVTIELVVDTGPFIDAMHRAHEQASATAYRRRVRHERSLGLAYVGTQLDDLARSVGMDPVVVWRLPRLRDELVEDLTHPDPVRRRAAEGAWLRAARAHQAQQAAARRSVDG